MLAGGEELPRSPARRSLPLNNGCQSAVVVHTDDDTRDVLLLLFASARSKER